MLGASPSPYEGGDSRRLIRSNRGAATWRKVVLDAGTEVSCREREKLRHPRSFLSDLSDSRSQADEEGKRREEDCWQHTSELIEKHRTSKTKNCHLAETLLAN